MELRIKEILSNKGMKVSSLADSIGITRESLSRIINGANTSIETLQKISAILNVEVWELFTPSASHDELTALISHKGDFYKASTIEELERIVEKIKQNKKY